ncbi:DUF3429 domain-containing protein [Microbulbifer salipaludis]|uniref:DUF3429 domain-containing protein n=1 Tax=Microbulbifer salipaludis TaxID=187980 RepID=A0ABS3E977_9GAMM|nr:DUF3429 domain-containing protein [Microbulbifer salipaludis]MBN8431869.1 DUF3429 domain-containing protein [Microbulbifer salipaludis]
MTHEATDRHGDTPLFNGLAYLGAVPFVIGVVMALTGVTWAGVDGRLLFTAYSAVILSFLCGIWWGGALNRVDHPYRVPLMLASNLVALAAWLALLFYDTRFALPALALGYVFVERAEARWKPNRPDLTSYFKTRSRITYFVVACHVLMIALLWR